MQNYTIPSVDLLDFTSGNDQKRQNFIETLGKAFTEVGFVAVKNHKVDDALVENLYRVCQSFFDLPDEVKSSYDVPGLAGQRGYTGKGKEHAKNRNTGDLKEFFHIGQEVEKDEYLKDFYPKNIWPGEVPDFEKYTLEAYQKLETTGKILLSAIALFLGLPETYFDSKIEDGNSILRPLHYFPILEPDLLPSDAVRAAEHEDINLITLLMGASADGLQILNRKGEWVSVTALPEQIVVNVGDMLSRLTNNVLKSTTHRVVNPPYEKMHFSRYSIPFFLHPKPTMDLTCLEQCISSENLKRFDDITAGEYLNQRLRELGLLN
jgi:isopenicillin N synthase-like dioxygenase